jgi:sugar lactone lactonase YvrE
MRSAVVIGVLAGLLGTALPRASAHDPVVGPMELFASGVAGPEGLAFVRGRALVVGTTTGDVLRFERDGSSTVLASVGEALAGITELRDRRVLAAALAPGRVWSIAPDGTATVFASGIAAPNFIVQTRRTRRILVSASGGGAIMDITDGTPVVAASGLVFPNGLAIGRDMGQRYLYVAETLPGRIARFPLDRTDALGPKETYATANLAFGRGGFRRLDAYLVNFGPGLGDGTTIVRFRYNHGGVPLIR